MTAYSRANPSPRYLEMGEIYRALHREGDREAGIEPEHMFPGRSLLPHVALIGKLVKALGAKTLLDYGAGKGLQYQPLPPDSPVRDIPAFWGVEVSCYDAGHEPFSTPPTGRHFDAVISTDMLEHCPEEDLPWIVEEMFAAARKLVYLNVACYPAGKTLPNGENAHITLHPPAWWHALVDGIARRHPGTHWVLRAEEKRKQNGKTMTTVAYAGTIRVQHTA